MFYNQSKPVRVHYTRSEKGLFRAGSIVNSGLLTFLLLSIYVPIANAADIAPPAPNQLPTGGQVNAGNAQISQTGNSMTINQNSERAVIDWMEFDVGRDASVRFDQPSAESVILNRVQDSNPSQIFGELESNGQVFLTNPNGILFGENASVNVGGLAATTGEIDTDDFMAGDATFDLKNSNGAVVNKGNLSVSKEGYIALLAPEVRNEGVIIAQAGTVALAAGDAVTLNFERGSHLASITVTPASIATVVENKHAILAPGGQIILSARATEELIGSVVQSGELSASSLVKRGGRILLEGDDITIASTSETSTTGTTGGGEILIGGDWQGSGDIHQATTVTMESGAKIDASATDNGDGGKVVLWSDITDANSVTEVHGEIKAQSGINGGRGGKVETSGHHLNTSGVKVNTLASNGDAGLWLFDPEAYNIAVSGGDITGAQIASDLNTSNIEIFGTGAPYALTVNDNIFYTGANDRTLTLKAIGDITFNSGKSITSSTGKLNVVFRGDTDNSFGDEIAINGTIATNGGGLWIGAGGIDTLWTPYAGASAITVGNIAITTALDNVAGLTLEGASITTSGGNIKLWGSSSETGDGDGSNFGIYIDNSTISSGAGSIDITGELDGRYNTGSGLSLWSNVGDITIESTTGAITLTGNGQDSAGTDNGWRHGLLLLTAGAGDDIVVKSASGKITLDGTANFQNGSSTDTSGLQLQNGTTTSSIRVVSTAGDIDLKGTNTNANQSGDTSAIRLTAQDAAGNIKIGFDGSTAYSGNILIQGDRILKKNTNAGTGNISAQSTGALALESKNNDFSHDLDLDDDWNFGSSLSSLTVGKSGNDTNDISITNAITTNGDISFYAKNINLNSSLISFGAGSDVLLQTSGYIIGNGSDITTNGGDITLHANVTDINANAYIYLQDNTILDSRTNADRLAANTSTATGGGNIILGGGSNLATGYAVSNSSTEGQRAGIALGTDDSLSNDSNVEIYSGGGNITLRGESTAASSFGIQAYEGLNIDAGTIGDISLKGNSNSWHGIELTSFRNGSAPTLLRTMNGDISLSGTNTDGGGFTAVQFFANDSASAVTIAATGTGAINIDGTTNANYREFDFRHVNILAAQGDISITGTSTKTLYLQNVYLGSKLGSLVTSSTSEILIEADNYNFPDLPYINTSGDFTWNSVSNSFGQAVSANWWNYNTTGGQTLSNVTIGKTTNTSDLNLDAAMTFSGDYSAYGKDITLNTYLTDTGGSGNDLLVKATGNIIVNSGADLTTNGGDITLWSDSDASGLGYINLAALTDLTSNGGAITLSGGADLTTGYARANGAHGISIGDTTSTANSISSSGGDILIRGWADLNGGGFYMGAKVHSGTTINSGAGSIGLYGKSDDFYGIEFGTSTNAGVIIESAKTSGSAIIIDGISTVDYGTVFNFNAIRQVLATAGGDIAISGVAGSNYGIFLLDVDILATTGTITLDGGTLGIISNDSIVGYKAGSSITSSSSDINIIGDVMNFGASTGLQSSGNLNIYEFTAGTTIGLAGGPGDLNLDATEQGSIQDGFSSITIGSAVSGKITAGAGDFNDDLILKSGSGGIEIVGYLNTYTNDLTLTSSGATTQSSNIFVDGVLNLNGTGAYALDNQNNFLNTLTANSGSINIKDTSGGFNINSITSTGTVELATHVDNLTVSGNISGTSIVLNAGKNTASGTSAGGNVILSGSPTLTASTGNSIIYTGSISGSTGVTTLVGSGSGSFRYNSDETSTNYSKALGGIGTYAIYREQPTLTITADDKTVTYGSAPSLTTSISSQNGDTTAQALSTAASVSVGGTTSTSGNYTVGTAHALTASGAADLLGYAISYVSGSLTVLQKALTLSGITAVNKVYNGNTTAAANFGGAIFSGLISGDDLSLSAVTGLFANKNVGTEKTVTLNSSYAGTDLANYSITDQASSTANITAKSLAVFGITAANKTYDGNTSAIVDGSGVGFAGLVSDDTVSLSSTSGAFGDKNVGTGKTVTLTNIFAGADVNNYTITDQASTTADITAKSLTVSGITAANKIYDQGTTAVVDGSGVGFAGLVSGDTVSLSSTSGVFSDKNVAAGKTVTLTNIFGGTDLNNYSITDQASTTADITAKGITISGITATNKIYDGNTTATVDGTGVSFSGLISGDTLSLSSTSGAFNDKNVGSGKIVTLTNVFAGADVNNYSITDQASITADITAKALTVSGITASNKIYDGNAAATVDGSGVTFDGLVSGDTLSLSSTSGAFNDKNVGAGKTVTLTNNFGGADLANYSITDQASTTANITVKGITISGITASNKIYNGNVTATVDGTNVAFGGLVSGDTVSLSTTSGAFNDKNVGTGKTVTLTNVFAGADVNNYSITDQASTTADITAKTLTASGITASNKIYDGNTTATVDGTNVAFGGLVSGDTISLSTTSGAFNDKNVGTGKMVTLTNIFAGADVNNYSITDQASTTADITVKGIIVSGISASNKTYDGNTTATVDGSGVGFAGLVSGDIVSLSSVGGVFSDKNVGTGKTVTLTNTFAGLDLNNYSFTDQASTTADITTKAINVSGITASNKTYDGNTTATVDGSGVTFGGLISGDNVLFSAISGLFSDKNVATGKTVTLSSSYGGTDVGNYSITDQASTAADITAKGITVSGITASNKTYDGNTTATVDSSGVTFGGLISGDNVLFSAISGLFSDKNVGAGKTVTLSSSYGGTDLGNYSLTDQVSTTADITAKSLTVSGITAANKVYDQGTTAVVDGSGVGFAGLVSGDTVSLSSTSGVFSDKNVATGKTVTLTNTFGGTDLNNYSITDQASATADITAKAITASGITASNKTYDGNTTATVDGTSVSFSGLISGDTLSLSSTSGAFNDKNVGAGKTVTLTNVFAGTDVNNYSITDQASTTANITQKTLTISGITASNKAYDGNTSATVDGSGVGFAGLVSGDTISLSSTGGLFDDKNVGTGKSVTLTNVFGGTDLNNYSIVDQVSTTANITTKGITVSGITASNKTYDGNTTATVDGSGVTFVGLVSGDTISLSTTSGAFNDKNVGTGKTVVLTNTFGGSDLGNYTIVDQASTTANITTKGVTVSGITAANKAYDGNTTATVDGSNVTFTGLVSGDVLSLATTSGAFNDKNVGSGKLVTLTNSFGGIDLNNYSITDQASTTADITAKGITVSGITASNKIYDGNSTATVDGSGVTFAGLVSGDTVSLTSTSGVFSDKNVGSGKAVALTNIFGGIDFNNYSITDQVSTTADISAKSITVSGITAANKTYDGNTTATVDGSGVTFGGLISGDNVLLSAINGLFSDKNVAAVKTVTLSSSYSGTDVNNYSIVDQASTTADITAKGITASGITAANKTYDGNTTATVDGSGITFGGLISGDNVLLSAISGLFSDKNVAAGKTVTLSSSYSGTDVNNYSIVDQASTMADITAKGIIVSGITAANKTYDGNTTATADGSGVTFGGLVSGDNVLLSAIIGLFSDKNVGAGKTVTLGNSYAGTDLANYSITDQASTTADITAKGITVSGITAANKTYDGNTTATVDGSGVGFAGLVSGDTVSLSLTSGAFNDKNVGAGKTVTLTNIFAGADVGNYSITDQASTTTDIAAKVLTISGITASNKTYDGNTTATVDGSVISFAGLVSGDTVSLSSTSGAFNDRNVGTNKTVTLSNIFGGADVNNYSIVDQASTTADVTAKALTISGITASNKTYDGNTTAIVDGTNVAFAGLVSGDTISLSITSGAFNDKNVGTGKTVTLTNTFAGADVNNYSIVDQASTTADITTKGVTVSGITASNKAYDGNTTATVDGSNVTFTGLVSGDVLSLATTSGAFNDKNVGSGKLVTLTNSFGGTDLNNYSITDQASTIADITAKGITVAGITAANKIYDGNTSSVIDGSGVTFAGLVSGDTVSLTSASGVFADKNVASEKIVALTNIFGGADVNNYSIVDQVSSTADISSKVITVSGISASNKAYDGNTTTTVDGSGVTFGGLLSGDNLLLSAVSGLFSDKNAGTGKTVTLNSSYGGTDVGNYTFTDQVSTIADITTKVITISGLTAEDKIYDGTTSAIINIANVVFGGIVSGDILSVISSGVFADKNVGIGKTVNINSTYGGADQANYTISDQVATAADVLAKQLTINLNGVGLKVYDGTSSIDLNGVTPSLSGIVSGDLVAVNGGSVNGFVDKNVGTNKSVLFSGFGISGVDSANYVLGSNNAPSSASITPRLVNVTGIAANDKTYDGTIAATVDDSNVVFDNLIFGDDLLLTAVSGQFADRNAGTGKNVLLSSTYGGADLGNYIITDQTLSTTDINRASLIIRAQFNSKSYDGNTSAEALPEVIGLIAGDGISGVSESYLDAEASTGKTVVVNDDFLINDGHGGNNYAVTLESNTGSEIFGEAVEENPAENSLIPFESFRFRAFTSLGERVNSNLGAWCESTSSFCE